MPTLLLTTPSPQQRLHNRQTLSRLSITRRALHGVRFRCLAPAAVARAEDEVDLTNPRRAEFLVLARLNAAVTQAGVVDEAVPRV